MHFIHFIHQNQGKLQQFTFLEHNEISVLYFKEYTSHNKHVHGALTPRNDLRNDF